MGSKKSARRAAKLRKDKARLRDDAVYVYNVNVKPREERLPEGEYPSDHVADPEVVERIEALVAEASDEQLNDGIDVQQRWEVSEYYYNTPAVFDNLTGLYALVEDRDEARAVIYELHHTGIPIEVYVWRHRPTDAEVVISDDKVLDQFWLLITDDNERGVLNRTTQKIVPVETEFSLDEAIGLVRSFNDFTSSINVEAFNWVDPGDWIADPPEDDPSRAAAAPEPGPTKPLRVLVVSSREWAYSSVVHELIQTLWNATGNGPMTILTSGMPYGAEGVASQLANTTLHEGATPIYHEIIRDEAIATADIDYAFAFITNYSSGASSALDAIKLAGIPVHVMNETSAQPNDPWAER